LSKTDWYIKTDKKPTTRSLEVSALFLDNGIASDTISFKISVINSVQKAVRSVADSFSF
jgi:hypothetical protein